jgi:hypothetical protein
MREQSCSIPRGLEINKNSAEGEVFFVDFPSYRTLQGATGLLPYCRSRLEQWSKRGFERYRLIASTSFEVPE